MQHCSGGTYQHNTQQLLIFGKPERRRDTEWYFPVFTLWGTSPFEGLTWQKGRVVVNLSLQATSSAAKMKNWVSLRTKKNPNTFLEWRVHNSSHWAVPSKHQVSPGKAPCPWAQRDAKLLSSPGSKRPPSCQIPWKKGRAGTAVVVRLQPNTFKHPVRWGWD